MESSLRDLSDLQPFAHLQSQKCQQIFIRLFARVARIFKNGSLYSDSRGTESNSANSYPSALNNSIIHMNGSSDYLEFYTYHGVGSSVNFSAGNDTAWAQGYLIG